METRDQNKRKAEKRPPIIDGDARPDINLNPEDQARQNQKLPNQGRRDKKVTTENRNDTNSLDDFRDARQE